MLNRCLHLLILRFFGLDYFPHGLMRYPGAIPGDDDLDDGLWR